MGKLADEIVAGNFEGNSLTADITPGGGKTGSATLLANRLLDGGKVDRVLWVVPRLSLAEQIREAFANGFGSCKGRELESVDGRDGIFCPSLPNTPAMVGAITTYQHIAHGQNNQRFVRAMQDHRTLVIFDEVQFLNDDSLGDPEMCRGWYSRHQPVRNAAAFALVMSGTLWRTDNRRIPFVEYQRGTDGLYYPLAHIHYDLRTAVAERAILPTEWQNLNGVVEYVHNGLPQIHDLLADDDDEESRKVRTFLARSATVHQLLDNAVDHWQKFRRTYQSRMIVMADDIASARQWRKYLEEHHGIPCTLATSKEEAAGTKLRQFRERKRGQCLVTVAMAYVGFDCPDLSHLVYLSAIRAPSWMLQSFARVSRFDPVAPCEYEHQHAYVFAPDDARMRAFMAWLRKQEDMGVEDRRRRGPSPGEPKPVVRVDDEFEPVDAAAGGTAVESLDGRLPPEVEARLADFAVRCPDAADLPKSKLFKILSTAGVDLG